MQLLGLHKKDEQVIKLANIGNAEIVYKKNIRISLVDFNPDYLNLYLDTKDGQKYILSLLIFTIRNGRLFDDKRRNTI